MATASVKDQVRQLVERLAEDATWEDVQYEIYVRQSIDAGLRDAEQGRTVASDEVRRRFGLGTK